MHPPPPSPADHPPAGLGPSRINPRVRDPGRFSVFRLLLPLLLGCVLLGVGAAAAGDGETLGQRDLSTAAATLTSSAAALAPSAPDAGQVPAPPGAVQAKWRIGYVETKPFVNYASSLAYIVYGLQDLGLISGLEDMPYQPEQVETDGLWAWLASRDLGPRIEFVADAYYSFKGLKGSEIPAAAEPIARRLREQRDLDLVIVMGTDAGKAMAKADHQTPVLIFSTSDAIKAGIINSLQDTGKDHVWAHMDPNRYRRQVEIFYDIFRFQLLGIAYEDSPGGRTFAAVEDVEAVARDRDFTIVREIVSQPGQDKEAFYDALLAANRRLADRVDAVYFGLFIGIDPNRIPEMLAPFVERRIPVFGQQGPEDVRHGALISVGRGNFRAVGRFGAATILKVLQGAKPRDLELVYQNSPNIVLNLEVARKIGYRPKFEILLVADEIFRRVEGRTPAEAD